MAVTDDIPIDYLKSYPHPAVVYRITRPPFLSRNTITPVTDAFAGLGLVEPRHPQVWSNTKWDELGAERVAGFDDWVEGDEAGMTLGIGKSKVHFTKVIDGSLRIITSVFLDPPPPARPTPSPPATTPRVTSKQILSDYPEMPPITVGGIPTLDCRLLLEHTDWAKTTLGPRENWSPVIETMIAVMMASPTQDSLWLGEDFQMIYNQNYSQIVHHPGMFGRSAKSKEAWGPVWDNVKHLIDACLQHGEACFREDDLLLYRRGPRGHFVEKYHTWSFVPLFHTDGTPLGLFNPTRETTADVLARRRQASTRDLSEQLLIARNSAEYFGGITEVLERNPKDVPFIMCYSAEEHEDNVRLTLESSVGVPEDHPAMPSTLDVTLYAERTRASIGHRGRLSSPALSAISAMSTGPGRVLFSDDKTSWPIAKALSTRQCVVVEDCTELIQGFELRQWESLPDSAIVVPICSETSTDVPRAVLIMGLNLLSPLDEVYEDWIHIMRAHLTSSLGSVRAYEAEAQRQLDRDRMERAKTAWFQGAAHDLRSPLTLVAGPLDDVLRTNLTLEQRTGLSLAQRNLSRVQRLVNSLLDFSRIEAGKLEGRFAPIDLGVFVNNLATLFRPAIERRRIEYKIEIEPHEGMVFVDPTLLETVVSNLLSNALKYTERGSITVSLTYTDHANIAISDSGFGIPQTELSAVTDRFHRATTALSRGTEGTGIGLALAKEILRLHGGELLIQSQTAEESRGAHGSTFTAQIPLVERQTVEDGLSRAAFGAYSKEIAAEAMHWIGSDTNTDASSVHTEESGEVSSRADGFLFDKSDVLLLVDDNNDMRHYVKQIFTPYCKVVEAQNGRQALELARQNPPQLILSDLMMPQMTGQELLEAIRENPTTRRVPMMLLSAAMDDDLRLSALIAGAEDFMTKPFKPKELLARVHLHMQMGKRRAHLESLYAQREKEIALLSDYCPSGIVRSDSEGKLVYANAAWRQIAGMAEDEETMNWENYVDPATRLRVVSAWDDMVHGEAREAQLTWKWLNGRIISCTFIRLDKADPTLAGVLGCASDITYQEEKLLEAERRRIEAEEAKHQQELLVDLTSHEIRTPVSAILQCSSLVKENLVALRAQLREGFVPSEAVFSELDEDVEALDSIHQCGLVQERIANDVLSLARIQLDMLTLHDVEMDLKKEARKVISVFASEAKMKKIELVLEFGESVDRTGAKLLKTDHVRLGQVVTNLVSNAIRFTASSEVRRITARYDVSFTPPAEDTCAPSDVTDDVQVPAPEDTPVWLFVSVKDTGPGLGPKEQAALFRRFSQGNKMIHTKYGGSGLGLFICKRISELLGGRIEMKSQLGVGSEFRFFIQCRTVTPLIVQPILAQTSAGSTVISPSPVPMTRQSTPSSAGDMHLLIVEDNIINQTVLKRQLIKAGLSCDVANNGEEALALIHGSQGKKGYDAVLMDLEMPVMDGLTAIRHIRAGERDGTLDRQLVVALTGNARQGQIDQAFAAGMDDVVIKPYKLPDLISKLRKAVRDKQDATTPVAV